MKNNLHYLSSQRHQPRADVSVHCGAQEPPQKFLPDITRNRADYGSNHVHSSPQEVRVITDKLTEVAENNPMELVGRTTTDEAFEIRCKIEVPTAPDPTRNESWQPVRPTETSPALVLEPGTFFAPRPKPDSSCYRLYVLCWIQNGCTVAHNAGVIPMTRPPVSCPVCGRLIIEPLLKTFRLTAEGEGLIRDVHAMKAFHCQEEGHIFFIRASDLEAEALRANT